MPRRKSKTELAALEAARLANRRVYNYLSSVQSKQQEYYRNYEKRRSPESYAKRLAQKRRCSPRKNP